MIDWRRFIILAAIFAGRANAMAAEPAPDRAIAQSAVNDLLNHFWIGDESTGRVVNTWHGYPDALPDPRGALWERAMMMLTIDDAARALHDEKLTRRIAADWRRTRSLYTAAQLMDCGQASSTNWASDDAGWSALMYLAAYRATHDLEALDCARGLVRHAFDRWLDPQLGGGLWYRDDHSVKSLYQTALILAALDVWELTGDQPCHDKAVECYQWIEGHLLRPDGLYWCDIDANGPRGTNRSSGIQEGSSPVYLAGNMAMGVLHARMFRLTSDVAFRARAVRTADALLLHLTSSAGVYINDRDAWTDGVFAGDWARDVLTLPGVDPKSQAILRATADSIFRNARTTDGYYGASWSGPADGPGSVWFVKKSRPKQIMTSAMSVNMIVAAAFEQ